jgi:long-chain acyl-CoA synthetase
VDLDMVIKYKVSEDRPFYKSKFYPAGVPHQLDYDYSMTTTDLMNQAVEKWPDNPVIWFLHGWITYKQLKGYIESFATALVNLGVKKGDTIALILPNCPQYVVAYYAGNLIGAPVSGVNPTYKAMEALHQIKTIKAKIVICLDALYPEIYKPLIGNPENTVKTLIWTNIADMATGLSPLKKFLGKKLKKIPTAKVDAAGALAFNDLLKTPANVTPAKLNAEKDIATYMMSGGTTGVPKAIMLTHQNVVSNAMMCKVFLLNQKEPGSTQELGVKTAMMGVLPLFHSFAHTTVMNSTFAVGGYMVLFPKPPPTEELLADIMSLPDYNGTIYCAAEILFQRIATLPDEVLAKYPIAGRLKLCVSGAGPLHDYVREPFEKKTGARIVEGYGLAEAAPVVSANNFFGERETGYIGVPFPGTDWNIFPADDFSKGPLPPGEENVGEICVCGPQVMPGYLGVETEELKQWDGRTWLCTGDIGYMTQDGRIKIKDRKKQLIKMSGHSVFPAEVESLIGNHPKVLEVAVAGLPDQKLGEAVKAWVALKPEAVGTITTDELMAWCKENMTNWKVPKYIEFIQEVPKNAIGKVMRRTLQEQDPLFKKK